LGSNDSGKASQIFDSSYNINTAEPAAAENQGPVDYTSPLVIPKKGDILNMNMRMNTLGEITGGHSINRNSSVAVGVNEDYAAREDAGELKQYFRKKKSIHTKTPRNASKKDNRDIEKVEKMLNHVNLGAWRRTSIEMKRNIKTADHTTRRYTNQNLKTIEFLEDL